MLTVWVCALLLHSAFVVRASFLAQYFIWACVLHSGTPCLLNLFCSLHLHLLESTDSECTPKSLAYVSVGLFADFSNCVMHSELVLHSVSTSCCLTYCVTSEHALHLWAVSYFGACTWFLWLRSAVWDYLLSWPWVLLYEPSVFLSTFAAYIGYGVCTWLAPEWEHGETLNDVGCSTSMTLKCKSMNRDWV